MLSQGPLASTKDLLQIAANKGQTLQACDGMMIFHNVMLVDFPTRGGGGVGREGSVLYEGQ